MSIFLPIFLTHNICQASDKNYKSKVYEVFQIEMEKYRKIEISFKFWYNFYGKNRVFVDFFILYEMYLYYNK